MRRIAQVFFRQKTIRTCERKQKTPRPEYGTKGSIFRVATQIDCKAIHLIISLRDKRAVLITKKAFFRELRSVLHANYTVTLSPIATLCTHGIYVTAFITAKNY